jgi:AcrR family transcriptional regulator
MKMSTRDRLLTAAQAVFLEHGFENTTVQMIDAQADANIAAVNYHYGSKADLYAACIARHLEDSVSRMPTLDDRPGAPFEQLEAFVRWFFTRYHEDSLLRRLNRDLGNLKPTFLNKIVETVIRPEFENCSQIIAAILPQDTDESTIRAHVLNIIALCVAPMHGFQLFEHLYPELPFGDQEIRDLRERTIQLIVGGLRQEAGRINSVVATAEPAPGG